MRHFTVSLVAVLVLGFGLPGVALPQAWRMNCGGVDYTTVSGDFFQADSPYVSGDFGYVGGTTRTYTHVIEGTNDETLYQTIRFSTSPGFNYVYDNMPAGIQRIILCFMEPVVSAVGDRLMDISAEGVLVLDNFDIFAAAGAQWTAVSETLYVDIQDGQLNIDFDVETNNPAMVSAIAVGLSSSAVYSDITSLVGITAVHRMGPSCATPRLGSGSAWADYDNDGDIDLFITDRGGANYLYRNDGDTNGDGLPDFTDVAANLGVQDGAEANGGCVFVDYDNDGDQDLYVCQWGGNTLFKNTLTENGFADFMDVTAVAGVGDAGRAITAAWGDFDSDGYLDLFLAKHFSCLPDTEESEDGLYKNNGDGTFSDFSPYLCPGGTTPCPQLNEGHGSTAGWFDYDNDGDQDLYEANDTVAGGYNNILWRNDGPDGYGGWIFTDVTVASGTDYSINCMGLGQGDYNNDGWFDLAFSHSSGGFLLSNNGDGTFLDVTDSAGVRADLTPNGDTRVCRGTCFFDHDNDMWLDLFYVAGFDFDTSIPQPDAFFHNNGDGTFDDWSDITGLNDPGRGRSASMCDFDQDGFVDIFLGNYGGGSNPLAGPLVLYHNNSRDHGNNNHWLTITLTGTLSNRDAIGARLHLTTPDGITQMRQITSGPTHGGGDYKAAYFGMGTNTTGTLSVEWPSGFIQDVGTIGADQTLHFVEDVTSVDEAGTTPARFGLKQNYPNPFNPTTTIGYSLNKETRVTLKVYDLLGQEITTLVDEIQPAGFRQIEWKGKNQSGSQVATGMYIYRMNAGNFVESHKMILSK